MKRVISIIIVIVLIISVGITSFASSDEKGGVKKFTLKDAIEYAVANSRDMKIQVLELEKARKLHEEHDGYIRRGTDEYKEEYYSALNLPPTHQNSTVNKELKSNGAKKKNIDLSLNIGKWNGIIIENKIRYDTEKAYYDLLKSKQDLDIANEDLKLAMDQHNQSVTKMKLGTISVQQLITAEMALYQAQADCDSAIMGYENQSMSFNNSIGLPLSQKIELVDEMKFKNYEYVDFESDVKEAFENSALLKVAIAKREISRLTLKAVEDSIQYKGDAYREQEIELEKADNNIQSTKNNVELSLRSSGMALLNLGKQLKTYNLAVNKAQKNYELAQLSFKLGQNTPNEVNQAKIDLMNGKRNLSKQIYAYNLAYLDNKYSTGLGREILR